MNKLAAAQYFAGKGICVFRLNKNAKTPAFSGWQEEATTCIETLTDWFSNDDYNIGLKTGKDSNLNVIDVDIKNGVDGRNSLKARFGDIATQAPILQFKTPSGGYHIPVKWTPETDVSIGSKVCGLDGVDIRGNGGYIVAPSSTIEVDGELISYQLNDSNLPITEPVDWIKSLLCDFKSNKRTERFNPTSVMQGLKEGERNDTLFRYACHLRYHGIDKELLLRFVEEAANRCSPPFPSDEVHQIIHSAFSYKQAANKSNSLITLSEVLS